MPLLTTPTCSRRQPSAKFRIGYLRNNDPFVSTQITSRSRRCHSLARMGGRGQPVPEPELSDPEHFQGIGPAYGATSQSNIGNTYSIAVNITKIIGTHSIKFGGEARKLEWYNWLQGTAGSTSFDTSFTQFNPLQGNGTGNAFAAFLLGFPTSGSTTYTINASQYEFYNAIYAQDTYKASNKLTVNYGVRWDISPGKWEEKHGNAGVFNPGEADPLAVLSPYITHPSTGQVDFVNSSQNPTSSLPTATTP